MKFAISTFRYRSCSLSRVVSYVIMTPRPPAPDPDSGHCRELFDFYAAADKASANPTVRRWHRSDRSDRNRWRGPDREGRRGVRNIADRGCRFQPDTIEAATVCRVT